MKSILLPGSALALFVASITGTDDPDLAVTFDDLAEFTSAFHRRSDFHCKISCLGLIKSLYFQQLSFLCFRISGFWRHEKVRNHPFPSASGRDNGDAAQTKLVIVAGSSGFECGRWNDAARKTQYTSGIFYKIHRCNAFFKAVLCNFRKFFSFCGKYFSGNGVDRDKSCWKYCRSACKIDFCVLN